MGQGGFITLVNGTNAPWLRSSQNSYQMNNWDFPELILPYSSARIYVEWNQNIFHTQKDDNGQVVYEMKAPGLAAPRTLSIDASANPSFNISAAANFATQTMQPNAVVNLGWSHNGNLTLVLAGDAGGFPFMTGDNVGAWMLRSIDRIGQKTLAEIAIPGAHDAGMSTLGSPTAFSHSCNTQTQTLDIADQLQQGVRYFDIRPVIGGGEYYTGHYSQIDIKVYDGWQGARGQKISDVVSQINEFALNSNELIIVDLSHAYDTDAGNGGYTDFTADQWNGLLAEFKGIQNLYTNSAQGLPDFTKMTISGLIPIASQVIVIVRSDLAGIDLGNTFYPGSCLATYNEYSGTNDLGTMVSDQLSKMKAQKGAGAYFLLSWTLTQSNAEALCFLDPTGSTDSILDLASEANQALAPDLVPALTAQAFPNIVYVDDIQDSLQTMMALYVNELLSATAAYAFQSAAFPAAYIRMDGQGVTAPVGAGAGTVNAQIDAGPWEEFHLVPQGDGTFAIQSAEWGNVSIRLDGSVAGDQKTVNCQFGVGPWEVFRLKPVGGEYFAIQSVAFPTLYLALDTEGATSPNGSGVGMVYGTTDLGPKSQFKLVLS
ncbi:phosphatidylinositol-specific phospholipase C domain-containing protein [Defluviimonas salinarum]|uniref:1-phosphatidylinositol phosphodiesterase n=1 Tax=Defluviimonas salinarum TaxID=2992147 RepID=A0ABT3J6J5_9RHOB|nr:phosphatidylinositol-specific phospholipase C domain-containing protein [Defluviimonas salinarum]MCW3783024.1 hypothetical protein [Defluviimonas salinarum]